MITTVRWYLPLVVYYLSLPPSSSVITHRLAEEPLNNLKFVFFALGLSASAVGLAQQPTVSVFQTGLESRPTVTTLAIQLPKKFEVWVIDAFATRPSFDLVGPSLEQMFSGGFIRLAPYIRYNDDRLTRAGVAGLIVAGKRDGWQLISPFYAFTERGSSDLDRPGYWLPNLRVTHPLGNGFRGGIGLGIVNIVGKPVSLAVGPYVCWESPDWLFQLRVGRQLSPTMIAGTQIFAGLGYKF